MESAEAKPAVIVYLPRLMPTCLASPPWRPARVRHVLALDPTVPERVVLTDTERASWAAPLLGHAADPLHALSAEERVVQLLALFRARGIVPLAAVRHLSGDALREAIDLSDPTFLRHYGLLRRALATMDLDALPLLRETMGRAPREAAEVLLRVDSTAVARVFFELDGIDRYLPLHPRTSARLMLSIALGEKGPTRDKAVRVITRLDPEMRPIFRDAAHELGERASTELDALWAPDPIPSRAPKRPAFVDPTVLPTTCLNGGAALSASQTDIFLSLLACLPNAAARHLVHEVVAACEPSSLAALADGLLDAWLGADAPPKEKWVLHAVGALGGDRAARRLVDLAQDWVERGLGARAGLALEVVAEIGTDIALMHLDHIARTTKNKALKKRAEAALDAVRAERGWSADELSDRIVPTLGLEADGFLTLPFGGCTLRIGLDEALSPVAHDEHGARLRSMPRAQKGDDPEVIARATERLALLKKDAKIIAQDQVRRLERAMSSQRAWSPDEFDARLRSHPVMRHLARRLVWSAVDGDARTSFRCVDDGTLADAHDETFELSERAMVVVAHSFLMSPEERAAWSTILGDYELIQPFPQLQRETFTLTPEEVSCGRIERFAGTRVEGARFFSLKHRGWDFQDYDIGKSLGRGVRAVLRSEPGLQFLSAKPEDQTLSIIEIVNGTLADVSALVASELLRDVAKLSS